MSDKPHVPTESRAVDPARLAELTKDELTTMIVLLKKGGRADYLPRSLHQAGSGVDPISGE